MREAVRGRLRRGRVLVLLGRDVDEYSKESWVSEWSSSDRQDGMDRRVRQEPPSALADTNLQPLALP